MIPTIILASSSPQRKQILAALGLQFSIHPSSVDEESETEQNPGVRAEKLAIFKAQDIAKQFPESIVIGCDTLVVSPSGERLEKPIDAEDARRMLRSYSGATAIVHSGLCVIAPGGKSASGLSSSSVKFRTLQQEDIDWWVRTNLWQGRSGAFQIDGLGQLLIEEITGEFTSVVGFPVYLFGQLLEKVGYNLQEILGRK